MLQTLERTNIFDARVLTAAHADALRALAGPGGLPLLPCLHPALEEGQIVGDYAGQDELQAAAALLPLYAEDPLPTSLRAAGYGADGQGAVLTPPILREDYTQLRHFLRLALRWATERYASYHVWAVLPLDLEHPEACDDLCAQYLSAGLTLRGMRPMVGADQMLIFSAHGLVKWRDPLRRCHLADPALPRVLERGYAAADFGWGKNGLELVERTPLQVKQAVTGYGKATKAQVIYMVTKLLHLPKPPHPDDVADALAIGICTLHCIDSLRWRNKL